MHLFQNASLCLFQPVAFQSISILYTCGSIRLKSFSKPLNVTISWVTDNSSRADLGGTNLKWQMSPPIRPDTASWKATTNDSADFQFTYLKSDLSERRNKNCFPTELFLYWNKLVWMWWNGRNPDRFSESSTNSDSRYK